MTPLLRCAIYTRKSSEEGLDQTFNSLDAQREACAAYIQSQRHEGWRLLPTHYDDGGYSGGTLERPALKQLLSEVTAGTVDLIVVYKVDRLTRSLSDFAKIVDQLDAKKVSFVSVTQSFNTTTSMGRLTLNVLLSFAQFEREVTGERIRDKIAASKRKGMWMGGTVPLGYDVVDRKLVVNAKEAETVRRIFQEYLQQGGVARLRDALYEQGVRSKLRQDREGRPTGANRLTSGALFAILRNPLYRGEIGHRDQCYPGQHEAVVPDELWSEVQALRERTRRAVSALPRAQRKNPLLGLLVDDRGNAYHPTYTIKGHRRYRYYTTKPLPDLPSARIPADEIETHVAARLCAFFEQPTAVIDALKPKSAQAHKDIFGAAKTFIGTTSESDKAWSRYRVLIDQVKIRSDAIDIQLNVPQLRLALDVPPDEQEEKEPAITLSLPLRIRRTAHELRLVIPNGDATEEAAKRNPSLVQFVVRGRRWYQQITSGEMPSIKAIAAAENVTERYVARVLRGSLLAPDIIERILSGRQPVTMTVRQLLDPPPMLWDEQRLHFGIEA